MKKCCLGVLVLSAFRFSTHAAVLLSDSFDYSDGSLVTVSASKWTNHSGTLGELNVVAGRAFVTQADGEDLGAPLAGLPYGPATNALLYAGFTINFTNAPAPTAAGGYFAHFKAAGGSGFCGKIFATTNGVPAGFYRVGISKTASATTAAVFLTNNLSYHTDYKLVARYAPSNSASALWLNPASENDPATVATDSASAISVVAFALRESFSSPDGMGAVFLDDLIVATSFDEVVSGSPVTAAPIITVPPISQIATQGDNVTFTVAATGDPAPGYQWQLNGTNLAGATTTVLSLAEVATNQAGSYSVLVTNIAGTTNSDPATLSVYPALPPAPAVIGVSLLTYNLKGNGATDWSTNATQVKAIGRQLIYLNPDVITFNEIPWDFRFEMTNWITAFLPGYHLAVSTNTDGFICNGIASRFPIRRSNSWLYHADLQPYGYTNADSFFADNFTRDFFEAEIAVPGFSQALHVFVTHLKSSSGGYADAAAKRAAEAAAITNFFATTYAALYAFHPYTVSGDMNEDNTSTLAIQRLISPVSGLRLTSPVNPFTGSGDTYSTTSANPSSRLDYIFPCQLLFSNLTSSQVFRTDKLSPVPPNLFSNDCKVGSDHLPVLMTFGNPFAKPFRLLTVTRTQLTVMLKWESVFGQPYHVESATNLTAWTRLATNLVATNSTFIYATNLPETARYFRIYRVP